MVGSFINLRSFNKKLYKTQIIIAGCPGIFRKCPKVGGLTQLPRLRITCDKIMIGFMFMNIFYQIIIMPIS